MSYLRAVYWGTTSLVSVMLVLSAAAYFFHEDTIIGVRASGFPDAFRIQLAVLKLLGTVVLLLPIFSARIKEWAYAGVALFLLTAIVAHMAHGDPIGLTLINLLFFGMLVVSNVCLHRMKRDST